MSWTIILGTKSVGEDENGEIISIFDGRVSWQCKGEKFERGEMILDVADRAKMPADILDRIKKKRIDNRTMLRTLAETIRPGFLEEVEAKAVVRAAEAPITKEPIINRPIRRR